MRKAFNQCRFMCFLNGQNTFLHFLFLVNSQSSLDDTKAIPWWRSRKWMCICLFHYLDRHHRKAIRTGVLIHSSCYHNTIDGMAYKQQKCIPHSSEGWEVHDQGVERLSVWGAHFLFHRQLLFTVFSHGGKGPGSLWCLFYKRSHPCHEDATLMT